MYAKPKIKMRIITLSNPMAAPRTLPFVAGEQVSGLGARAGVGAGISFVYCGATLLETATITPNATFSLVPRLVAGHGHMGYDSRLSGSACTRQRPRVVFRCSPVIR